MKVLVVGSGGREHALAWALKRSPSVSEVFCVPGNAGIADDAQCVALDPMDFAALTKFCKANEIGLVAVGPEAPLVGGIVEHLTAAGIPTFGPTARAAELEGSKGFTKDLCARYNIPTAAYGRFDKADAAKAYIRAQGAPIVVKADGLAAGKGVIIAETVEQAEQAVDEIMGGRFGVAGAEVVVEAFLEGEEVSLFAISDGINAVEIGTAQDHKRVGEGDTGPNTGGMGAYSPAPALDDALKQQAMDTIVRPTVRAMAAEGRPFKGVLYAGLILTKDGPQLLEYNVRFGDPECQVLMMRLESDLAEVMLAAIEGKLDQAAVKWNDKTALTVVMAAQGYPGGYAKGSEIRGLDKAGALDGVKVFHAGTRRDLGRIVANGGRVLNVTATGASVTEAQKRAYQAVDLIDWPQGFCRRDIGWRAVAREGDD